MLCCSYCGEWLTCLKLDKMETSTAPSSHNSHMWPVSPNADTGYSRHQRTFYLDGAVSGHRKCYINVITTQRRRLPLVIARFIGETRRQSRQKALCWMLHRGGACGGGRRPFCREGQASAPRVACVFRCLWLTEIMQKDASSADLGKRCTRVSWPHSLQERIPKEATQVGSWRAEGSSLSRKSCSR